MFKCVNSKCLFLFLAEYRKVGSPTNMRVALVRTYPAEPKKFEFSEDVHRISEKFVKTYNQSVAAEEAGLDELAGVGYRKALEFLIKDYLIEHENVDPDKVASKFLGTVINNFVKHESIKEMARQSAILGNDEAHYVRKHEDYDIENLKVFLNLTVKWIEMELDTAKLTGMIQSK
ncbi:DUF4145 domain-containing protein [Geomicrobium sediminis]|uniref:Lysyl-tRNA synthetase class I n=1 Tax=Geomicrobium sediminis TaxID=1347788 RepID=A0ABS2P711_9BACL|nr:DUF4145 domain-containing protein [Geomicrobium sediminis]MBM7631082.1 lysyl-tRNA synthetase class I [Geomicrobium sediminis]